MYTINEVLVAMYIGKNPCCYKKQIIEANPYLRSDIYAAIKRFKEMDIIYVVKKEFINTVLKTQEMYALTEKGTKYLNIVMRRMKHAYDIDTGRQAQYLKDKKGEPEDQPVLTTHTFDPNLIGEQAGYVLDDGDW